MGGDGASDGHARSSYPAICGSGANADYANKAPGANPGDVGNKYANLIRVQDLPAWLINGTNNKAAASMHVGLGQTGAGSGDGGSSRRGGLAVQVVMADGAVRLMSENMHGGTWQALGQMADGEVIGEF